MLIFFKLLVLIASVFSAAENLNLTDEDALIKFLEENYNPKAERLYNSHAEAEWRYFLDLGNEEKKQKKSDATLELASFNKEYWGKYFRQLVPSNYRGVAVQRQVMLLRELGSAALDRDEFLELTSIHIDMMSIYSTAKVCPFLKQNCDKKTEGLSLNPDIEAIMASSTNYNELLFMWQAWRHETGRKVKDQYRAYVNLSNEVAKANNFSDKGAMWRSKFESETFEADVDQLWSEVEPLYKELHTYVLHKLKRRYKEQLDASDGLIPAHVLGNMWAQNWINVKDLVKPFPNAPRVDVTEAMKANSYTPLKMFQIADAFYKSLGLDSANSSYDVSAGAMIEKPTNRDVICHASAWDFYNKTDFRIKMCTVVSFDDFITIHHELGHIQYYMLYKNQPIVLRSGANPGFHEAVGDTIALSLVTPKHLAKLGLLSEGMLTFESKLNTLMERALERIVFLPFSLLVDKWRWDVFGGKVPAEKWNSHWWHYRTTLQKVKPPTNRSDDLDFDPGCKFHVLADTQYISYFVAHILEFQLHKALCRASGQYDVPLNECDVYGSIEAGKKLRAGLSLGGSKHWKVVLKEITGESDLSSSAILEYFEPLYTYLREYNSQHNIVE